MADATPSFSLPLDAPAGVGPDVPPPLRIGPRTFVWGARTYLMGIVNVTADSFSGDGLLARPPEALPGRGPAAPGGPTEGPDPGTTTAFVAAALAQARRMVAEGADILDVGGESSRPGHPLIEEAEELRRTVPVVRAVREALPEMPISIDTVKPAVAEAALAAGADLINDVWGVGPSGATIARVAAAHGVPLVVMHNREEARYVNVVAEVLADLERALERATALGVARESLIVDPGMGFGKTADQNLALFRHLDVLRTLGRPLLLGMSRKSTIGRVLDLPALERLEGTLATTALGVGAGVDIVRVHDVEPNRRAARMADAIVRRGDAAPAPTIAPPAATRLSGR